MIPTQQRLPSVEKLPSGVGELVLPASLALEYEAICHLPEHRLASGLSEKEVGIFVNTIIGLAEPGASGFMPKFDAAKRDWLGKKSITTRFSQAAAAADSLGKR